MERTSPQSIGDILRIALQEDRMQGRLDECRAVDSWPAIVGPEIAASCRRPSIKNGVMTVGVPNASLRNELAMNRSSLINAVNGAVGRKTLTEIRFIS